MLSFGGQYLNNLSFLILKSLFIYCELFCVIHFKYTAESLYLSYYSSFWLFFDF